MKNDDSLTLIKMLIVLILFITFLMWSFVTEAGDYRHKHVTNVYNEYNETLQYSYDGDVSKGVALSLATYHPFDFATQKWQGSINGAAYDGQNAVSFGLAKRFEGMDALLHTSYGQNAGKDALTFGALWRF